ncbi:MAG: class I SAM-dependent methyltransferase [Thermoplasmata archaeon]|nr:class I SAM-dependent methyltransferase [Thermoplasmata archaeon]
MTHGLHPAVEGFDRAAEAYERGRPGYPEEALAYLREALRLRPGDRVLDLGAGTGKFTRAMRPWSARRIALEPVPGMRAVFRRASADAELVIARAETLPLRTASVDAVVAAQSFHWFRQPETLREIRRVLRPTGALALVWNRRDESLAWTKRLGELIDTESGEIPRSRSEAWRAHFEGPGGVGRNGFGPLTERTFSHVTRMPPDAVIDRVLSISAIGLLPAERQRTIAEQVRSILDEEPLTAGQGVVDIPYRLETYVPAPSPDPS